jgi:hypothetical protein
MYEDSVTTARTLQMAVGDLLASVAPGVQLTRLA